MGLGADPKIATQGFKSPPEICDWSFCSILFMLMVTAHDIQIKLWNWGGNNILLYCSETRPIKHDDVSKLETAQMVRLRGICSDNSWGTDSTPCAVIRKKCQTTTIQNLITYHRLRWLGIVCRMQEEWLPTRMQFGRFAGQLPKDLVGVC